MSGFGNVMFGKNFERNAERNGVVGAINYGLGQFDMLQRRMGSTHNGAVRNFSQFKNTGAQEETYTNQYQSRSINSDTQRANAELNNMRAHDRRDAYANNRQAGGNNQDHGNNSNYFAGGGSVYVPPAPDLSKRDEKLYDRRNAAIDAALADDGKIDEKEQKKIDRLARKIGKEDMAEINNYNRAMNAIDDRAKATTEFRDAVIAANILIDPQQRRDALEAAFDKVDALKNPDGSVTIAGPNNTVLNYDSPALAVKEMSERQAELLQGKAFPADEVATVQSFKLNPALKTQMQQQAAQKNAGQNNAKNTGTASGAGEDAHNHDGNAPVKNTDSINFPAMSGALAQGTRSTHAYVPKISTEQVGALQEILKVNDPALANALETQAGGKGSFGPKTMAALIKATGLSKEEIHTLDFSQGIPEEIATALGRNGGTSKVETPEPEKDAPVEKTAKAETPAVTAEQQAAEVILKDEKKTFLNEAAMALEFSGADDAAKTTELEHYLVKQGYQGITANGQIDAKEVLAAKAALEKAGCPSRVFNKALAASNTNISGGQNVDEANMQSGGKSPATGQGVSP